MSEQFRNTPRAEGSLDDLNTLKSQAMNIKTESEKFVKAAKKLSAESLEDAEKLFAYAKDNWKSVLAATALLGISGVVYGKTKGKMGAAMKSMMKTKSATSPARKKTSAKKLSSKKSIRR